MSYICVSSSGLRNVLDAIMLLCDFIGEFVEMGGDPVNADVGDFERRWRFTAR